MHQYPCYTTPGYDGKSTALTKGMKVVYFLEHYEKLCHLNQLLKIFSSMFLLSTLVASTLLVMHAFVLCFPLDFHWNKTVSAKFCFVLSFDLQLFVT